LDVFLLKDGTLIVFHGGGHGQYPGHLTEYSTTHPGMGIMNLETYEETQNIRFNPDFAEFGCSPDIIRQGRIPTLKEVLLDAKRSGIIVKIELKGPGVIRPVLQLVQELDMVDQCHYLSFDHERIGLVRELHPERNDDGSYRYKTGALFDDLPDDFVDQALRVGASEVHLKYDLCTPSVVDAIHSNGMDSMIWMRGPIKMRSDLDNKYFDVGNEDKTMYATLLKTGVRQMCVNRPDVLLNMFSDA
jgi:glycerophosphoryl diester phosphodiesterase